MSWDYFVSHASEDKSLLVEPLAYCLRDASFSVWYDDFQLSVGDQLSEKIFKAMSDAKFGIVIFSKYFFAKEWPQRELEQLLTLEKNSGTRILPVWHDISASDIYVYSPVLADRKAAIFRDLSNRESTISDFKDKGLHYVSKQLIKASFPHRLHELPINLADRNQNPEFENAKLKYRALLNKKCSPSDVFFYLSGYHGLVTTLFPGSPIIIPGHETPCPSQPAFIIISPHGITGHLEICFLHLGPTKYDEGDLKLLIKKIKNDLGKKKTSKERPYNDPGPPYTGEYPSLNSTVMHIKKSFTCENVHWKMPKTWCLRVMILCGRRSEISLPKREKIRRESDLPLRIDSYDHLLQT